jgi:hypothetical protein
MGSGVADGLRVLNRSGDLLARLGHVVAEDGISALMVNAVIGAGEEGEGQNA